MVMKSYHVKTVKVPEGSTVMVLGYVAGKNGDAITSAEVSSHRYRVFDPSDESNPTLDESDSNEVTVYDSLQTDDSRWDDSTGFNVEVEVPPSAIPDKDVSYAMEVEFTMQDGSTIYMVASLLTVDIIGT